MKLIFKDSKLISMTKYVGEEETTQVLRFRGLLTRILAAQLKCEDLCFAENKMPRRFGELKLSEQIENCEVTLDGGTWLANQASHFKIARPKEATATNPSLEIQCNLHFGMNPHIGEWFDNQNKAEFELSIRPPKEWQAQGELAFEDEQPGEVEELDLGCVACNNSIPFQPGSDSVHDTGAKCTRKREPAALAPAIVMGGTRPRKGRAAVEA